MNTNITIGQYYPTNSIIHTLDPRTKIIFTFLFVISVAVSDFFITYFLISIFLIFVYAFSKIPFSRVFKGLKGIFIILIFTAVLNVLFFGGEKIIFEISFVKITYEGVVFSIKMVWKMVLFVVGASFMTFVTTPIEITDGLEKIMKPLKILGLPIHDIATMISIALRFIPIIYEETDKIKRAQMARGADFENGNIVIRAKSFIPVLVPLFVSSFRRADELAEAMESRCYGMNVKRSRMKELRFSKNDFKAAIIINIYIAVIFVFNYVIL